VTVMMSETLPRRMMALLGLRSSHGLDINFQAQAPSTSFLRLKDAVWAFVIRGCHQAFASAARPQTLSVSLASKTGSREGCWSKHNSLFGVLLPHDADTRAATCAT
jgi:hypothetical protein